MKNEHNFFRVKTLVLMLVLAVCFASCGDDDAPENLEETLDLSGVSETTDKITEANSLAEMEQTFAPEIGNYTAPQEFADVSLGDLIAKLEADLVISSTERQALSQGDAEVFYEVINRFSSFTNQFEETGESALSGTGLGDKLVKREGGLDEYIKEDYLATAEALQNFYTDDILEPLKVIDSLSNEKSVQELPAWLAVLIQFLAVVAEQVSEAVTQALDILYHGGGSSGNS